MGRYNTRALTEGAILAAITVIIGIIRFYIPVFFVLSYIWAVPIIIVAFRHGLRVSVISSVVAAVLLSIFTGPSSGLELFVSFALPGIAMGYMLNRHWRPTSVVYASGLVLAVCTFLGIVLGFIVGGIKPLDVINKLFDQLRDMYQLMVNQSVEMNAQLGASREQLKVLYPPVDVMMNLVKTVLPTMFILSGVFFAFINFKMTKLVLKRVGYDIEDLTPFREWRVSTAVNSIIAAALVFVMAEMYLLKIPSLEPIATNLFIIVIVIYFIIGLASIMFLFRKYHVNKAVQALILIIAAPRFFYLIAVFGAIDMTFDFRKLKSDKAGGV